MGERQDVACVSQVLKPSLDRCQHTHFVIEPGQLFGSGTLQGIEIMQQQVMDWLDNKGFFLDRLFLCGESRACSSLKGTDYTGSRNNKELGILMLPSSSPLRRRSLPVKFERTVVSLLWLGSSAKHLLLKRNFVGFPDLWCGPVGREFSIQLLIVWAYLIACL